MQETPTDKQISEALAVADAAIASAKGVRARVSRRRTPRRKNQLLAARQRCSDAAKPLRSFIGMIAWHDLPLAQEIAMKDSIAALRYERRQIDKMKL